MIRFKWTGVRIGNDVSHKKFVSKVAQCKTNPHDKLKIERSAGSNCYFSKEIPTEYCGDAAK